MKLGMAAVVAALATSCLALEMDLSGTWRLEGTDANGGAVDCPIAVPGGVHSALLANGLIPDVYFGRNEERTLWVARKDWTVERSFSVPAEMLSAREVVLRLEDCDAICTILVNGRAVGATTDRFQRYTFDVKPYLKTGENRIEGRGYEPLSVTHYKTPWMKNLSAEPKWPVSWEEQVKKEWDDGFRPVREIASHYADKGKEYLQRKMIGRFDDTIARGVFVYTGEFGVWRATPHKVALGLIEDYLSIWKERNIGWAMWDFRGAFGILDSDRTDVDYEDYCGHKLDRELLELLRRY